MPRHLLFLLLLLAPLPGCGVDASAGEARVGGSGTGAASPTAESPETSETPWRGTLLESPVPRPDVVLPDVAGGSYDLGKDADGSVLLVFFGYTYCPDVCPVHMASLAAVLRDLPHEITRHVEVVFVTADPARDTPERLSAWLESMHPRFVGLRGSRAQVTELERSLGLPASVVEEGIDSTDYFVGHASQVLAFGADGPARVVYPWGTRQRDWLRDIPRLVRTTVPGLGEG